MQLKFNLSLETLYLTVNIIDNYLEVISLRKRFTLIILQIVNTLQILLTMLALTKIHFIPQRHAVSRLKLQLVGCTAMLIASNYADECPPKVPCSKFTY